MNSTEFNQKRILSMEKFYLKSKCPNCKKIVIPRRINYFPNMYSGLLWCPKCFKGKAGMFWREI